MAYPYETKLKNSRVLFEHAISECSDPDCEIHHPGCIEDEAERNMASAWFLAGALRAVEDTTNYFTSEITGDRDARNQFLGNDWKDDGSPRR